MSRLPFLHLLVLPYDLGINQELQPPCGMVPPWTSAWDQLGLSA